MNAFFSVSSPLISDLFHYDNPKIVFKYFQHRKTSQHKKIARPKPKPKQNQHQKEDNRKSRYCIAF
jgi:hypothetical protein